MKTPSANKNVCSHFYIVFAFLEIPPESKLPFFCFILVRWLRENIPIKISLASQTTNRVVPMFCSFENVTTK